MRANRIRERWRHDEPVLNGWLSIPSGFAAEVMSHQGWDSLTVDMQHGLIDYSDAVEMLTAISTTSTTPMVRIPWLDPGTIMKVLDAGAYGVVAPMINHPDEAAAFVAATRYPPLGNRSVGPIRAALYGGSDYTAYADATLVRLAMIETRDALNELDGILSVDGLDAIYVGPADLALALGYPPGLDREEPELMEAIDFIAAKAREYGVVAGIHNGSADYARRMADKGFRLVTVGSDARYMATSATVAVSTFWGQAADDGAGGY